MRGGREGIALPVLLLLLLALTALAHGLLVLSLQELRTTRVLGHAYRSSEAAEAALRMELPNAEELRGPRPLWLGGSLGSGSAEAGHEYEGIFRWLDGEFFLVEGIGRSRGWLGERRRGWGGRALSPAGRMGAFQAGVETGGGGGRGDSDHRTRDELLRLPEAWPPGSCGAYRNVLDSLFSAATPPRTGPLGFPRPEDLGSASPVPPLGLLTGELLLGLADDGGSPSSGGAAGHSAGPFAGGNPSDSIRGCPGHGDPVFVATSGSLTLRGGRLCALVVAEGDLRLAGTTRVQGLALVGGDLFLEDQAVLEGFARVGGRLNIESSAGFSPSACSAYRVLREVPGLLRPYLLPSASGLNGF